MKTEIYINGNSFSVNSTLLTDVLAQFNATKPYVVAVNGDIVPQEQHADWQLSPNDKVDVVVPIFGG